MIVFIKATEPITSKRMEERLPELVGLVLVQPSSVRIKYFIKRMYEKALLHEK